MSRPRLLDTFCGAGGCSMGYYRAGFDVVGVDHVPQPHYPFPFILGDALDVLARLIAGEAIQASDGKWYTLDDFVAFGASPPCQAYSSMQHIHKNSAAHPDLIGPVRELLKTTSKPYVIENVAGAPLKARFMLCGTMFGLPLIRHRYFECPSLPFILMPPCDHSDVYDPWHGTGRTADKMRAAFGIDWMPVGGGSHKSGTIDNAIPPAYTEWIGRQLLEVMDV